ncbi:serine peptidase [Actinomadura fibrosa]|uniref:Serine peptidase n=1 Tax=Actinomadura fibrosa TaxID=111802 RepID=A0ABW2XG75_9ACTN|nr:serine peptidase [Actinomadura fibrosa]
MTRILGIHGIWNIRYYLENRRSAPAAADAVSRAWRDALTGTRDRPVDLRVCYYSHHLYRGTLQAPDAPELLEPREQELLIAWAALLRGEQAGTEPSDAQGTRTVRVRAAADWIAKRFPAGTRSAVLAFCREVNTYQTRPPRRQRAIDAVRAAIDHHRPDVLVAHSLGSVLAYEALYTMPDVRLPFLLTLGSPLGLRGVVFEQLRPAPAGDRGARPPGVERWVNVADVGDVVAIPPKLSRRFAGIEEDVELTLGSWEFHAVKTYLRTPEVRSLLHL